MELDRIEMLTEKYLEAETSVKEEQELQMYYTSGNVAPQLQEYIALFAFYKEQKAIEFTKKVRPVAKRKKGLYEWFAVAASVAIIGGVFLYNSNNAQQDLGTYEDPEVALQQTKEVLNMVSHYMNEGQSGLGYVAEFGETTSQIIKNN